MLTSDEDAYYRALFWKSRYDTREGTPWSELSEAAQSTTEVVRDLVRSLVSNRDTLGGEELQTLYHLCQNTNDGPSIEERRKLIRDLDLPSEDTERITKKIERPMGSVGSAMGDPNLEVGHPDEDDTTEAQRILRDCFKRLIENVNPVTKSGLIAAVEDLITIDFHRVQSGRMSPILHYLAPEVFPVINSRSRTGMELCFDVNITKQLEDYLDEREKFVRVRDEFSFRSHFRDLDWFFNWVHNDNNSWTAVARHDDKRQYWQAQPGSRKHNHPENLWPYWQKENVVSMGVDYGPVSEFDSPDSPGEIGEQGRNLVERMSPGDIVVAKAGHWNLLGIGVVTPGGYEYRTTADEWLEFSTHEKSRIHRDTRNVEWVFTVSAGDAINVSDWGMSKQFDNRAIVSYNCFYELRHKLVDNLGEKVADELEEIERLSASYLPESDPTPIDVPKQDSSDPEAGSDNQSYYWVNQNRELELKEGFLRSQDKKWQRDLTVLETGDIVFHYTNQAVRACSVVTTEARLTEMEGGEYYRVDVDTTRLDEPLPLAEIREELQDPDVRQEQARYPLNKNGNVIQAYLCHLTPEAGQYLLKTAGINASDLGVSAPPAEATNYFWLTANPSIWSVDDIVDGGDVFYYAYNDEGNKKRLFEAFRSAAPGDRVLFYESTPVKKIVAEGTVTEVIPPEQDDTNSATTAETPDTVTTDNESPSEAGVRVRFDRHVDGIRWKDLKPIPELEDAAPIVNRAQGSLFPLSKDEYETILALEEPAVDGVSQEALNRFEQKLTPPQIEAQIPETLYFEDADRLRREIEASLRSGKHIIFTGPPGTGKTKLAKAICNEATTHRQVDGHRFTTATSEWTAFDTIGGYVPSTGDGGQELLFEPRLFLKCFRQDRIVNEWLIIDEINRSDIDKAFGQLFSVLSGDSTELPYERERTVELLSVTGEETEDKLSEIIANPDAFPVTPSWRLIATMNTYDKTSLYEMSYAFMRRFNFIHVGVPPLTTDDGVVRTSLLDPTADDNYSTAWLEDNPELRPVLATSHATIAVLWQRINEHRVIGPSIVYDIIRYLDSYEHAGGTQRDALSSAVVSLVYPQLEGMRPEDQKRLIRSLTDTGVETEHEEIDLDLDGEQLKTKAADFFGISFDDDA